MKAYIFDINFSKVTSSLVQGARCSSEITVLYKNSQSIKSAHGQCRDCKKFCTDLQYLLKIDKCDADESTLGITISSKPTDARLGVKIDGDLLLSLSKLLDFNNDLWLKLYFSNLLVSYTTIFEEEVEYWTYTMGDTCTNKVIVQKDADVYKTTMNCTKFWKEHWVANTEKTKLSGNVKLMIGTENYE